VRDTGAIRRTRGSSLVQRCRTSVLDSAREKALQLSWEEVLQKSSTSGVGHRAGVVGTWGPRARHSGRPRICGRVQRHASSSGECSKSRGRVQRHATLVATKRAAKFECKTRIKRGPKRIGAWQRHALLDCRGFAQSETLRRKAERCFGHSDEPRKRELGGREDSGRF